MLYIKMSDLEKIFENWSHGTLYNRLEKLEIKGNLDYINKNAGTGIVTYNLKAVSVLKEQYLKEFIGTENIIEEHIASIVSSLSNTGKSKNSDSAKEIKEKKNDNIDSIDTANNVNSINDRYINENYVSKSVYAEMIKSYKAQIELLEKQLEKETANNEKLINTLNLREQKEVVIEQQNLVKLQQNTEIKTLDAAEEYKPKRIL